MKKKTNNYGRSCFVFLQILLRKTADSYYTVWSAPLRTYFTIAALTHMEKKIIMAHTIQDVVSFTSEKE